ncbi:twin-arginine translocation signal domain-containing protein [Actibacterium sp. 188UL27-1]|uniref:twin-arginine translocation signal domain-containing protein n=1 Tax=Actibacterium sp. 188UL27-1 TaxID=2786961 RepID=UPI00195C13CA|nr:twin-arginine translocation signal domain-containing protein [Actibacterium sp. 188UL27-1]
METKSKGESRRGFLKLAGTSAPAAVALAVTGTSARADTAVEAGEGMVKTDHVKKYLESARF